MKKQTLSKHTKTDLSLEKIRAKIKSYCFYQVVLSSMSYVIFLFILSNCGNISFITFLERLQRI